VNFTKKTFWELNFFINSKILNTPSCEKEIAGASAADEGGLDGTWHQRSGKYRSGSVMHDAELAVIDGRAGRI